MRRDPNVLLMGEDIAGSFGGAFKVTKDFEAEFGARRVINTPLAELGFVGAATGMALMGLRPVIEMQFADFISSAFDSDRPVCRHRPLSLGRRRALGDPRAGRRRHSLRAPSTARIRKPGSCTRPG